MTEQELDALAFEHTRTNKRADLAFKAGYQAAMNHAAKIIEAKDREISRKHEEWLTANNERLKLKKERDAYKKAAQEWMNDYDKLKNKYEPMFAVTSEGETK